MGKGKDSLGNTKVNGNVSGDIVVIGNKNKVEINPLSPPPPASNDGESKVTVIGVAAVLVVLIVVVGIVLWGLMHVFRWAFPSNALLSPTPATEIVPSPAPTLPPATATFTAMAAPQETPSLVPSATPSVPPAAPPSATPPAETMVAILTISRKDGKAPFDSKLDARASYVRFADGRILVCETGFFCTYRFTIFRDSKYVESLSSDTGALTYRFDKKGTYQVAVYVCWREVCGEDGDDVIAR